MTLRRICIAAQPGVTGGPASFQRKLTSGLKAHGIDVSWDLNDTPYDVVLVINGTRRLVDLIQCRRRGIPVVQRLGGLNWNHRPLPFDLRNYMMAEIRNLLMRFIRSSLADQIIYQSHFVEQWWTNAHGKANSPAHIIYNGVDLDLFNPAGATNDSAATLSLISVEGLQWDKNSVAADIAQRLAGKGHRIELHMLGQPFSDTEEHLRQLPYVKFHGLVPNSELPFYYRGATVYILNDVIAACPNSVLEAMACGTPAVGYREGALPELLGPLADELCVDYISDPWKLQPPQNGEELASVVERVASNLPDYRQRVRKMTEQSYGLQTMVERYIDVFSRCDH
jgi:glycosyltransferase involved in cell wall biosynthesis